MKLLTFLVFSGIMQIHAAGYSQNRFTLNEPKTTVKEMFRKIENNSNYTIFYRQDQVNLTKPVTVLSENAPIEAVMKQVLKGQPLTFEVLNNMVIIKPLVSDSAQPGAISGSVTDDRGEPLIGASVIVKGTANGVSTDFAGRFVIQIAGTQNVTLVVKYIGFKQQEISAKPGQTGIRVALLSDAAALNEVVVIGYGTVKKRDLTGSVASVRSEDIVRIPTHNAMEAIQGRVPGADITRSSGDPGAGSTIVIRGNKSITTRDKLADRNGPLYIIDGFQGGDINTINPNDIASIDVLKDASSTAIYGAQGANGVIIVTTKKGAEGKVKVSYNGYYGVSNYSFPESRTGDDYIQLRREAGRAAGVWSSPDDDAQIFNVFTGELDSVRANHWNDWVDLLKRDGTQQNHAVSVTAGSDKTKVFASVGYFSEEGMLRNSDYKRYSARFNVDQILSKWAKVGILSQVTYSKQNQRTNPLAQAATMSPLGQAFDANGLIKLYPIDVDKSKVSPLADERSDYIARNNTLATKVIANGYLELTPVKGLTFRSNLGTNLNSSRQGIYNDKESLARYTVGSSLASSDQNYNRFFNWDNILTYNKEAGPHSVTLTGITSYIQSDADRTFAQGINQLLSSQLFYNIGGTSGEAGARTIDSRYEGWNNMAYAGRLNYSYKGKYLLTLSGRFDGASRLAEGNKWDFFPSAAVGWNISEEKFMDNLQALSNLKLRASYGVSGNYSIDVYGTQSFLVYNPRIGFGDVSAPGYQFSGRVGNPDLGWEKSASYDIGLDIGMFRDRVTATIDAYKTVTSDILLPRQLPISSGVTDVYENIGETQNKAIELSLSSQNIQGKNFKWSSTFTFSRNREKITKLIDGKNILSTTGVERNSLLLGHPISSFYTFRKLGIWQQPEAEEAATYTFNNTPFKPGDIKLADLNGDHIITAGDDMTYIGSTVPKWIGGLQNNFTYKNFDLSVYVFARYGQMLDAEFLGRYNPEGKANSPAIINYWTPENPTNDFPRPMFGSPLTNYAGYQTLNFVDGSYFKIRNISVGYTLPQKLLNRVSVNRLRIYATASNVLTIAKSHLIKDYDPERGGSESSPLSRQIVFGVNLDL